MRAPGVDLFCHMYGADPITMKQARCSRVSATALPAVPWDIGVSGYHFWISDESGYRRVFTASRAP